MHEQLKIKGEVLITGAVLERDLGISAVTRQCWVKANRLPQPLRIGNRAFFRKEEVEDYLLNQHK